MDIYIVKSCLREIIEMLVGNRPVTAVQLPIDVLIVRCDDSHEKSSKQSGLVEKSKAGCREGVTESSMGKMSSSIPNISMKIKARLCLLS